MCRASRSIEPLDKVAVQLERAVQAVTTSGRCGAAGATETVRTRIPAAASTRARRGGCGVAISGRDDQAAHPGAGRVADVERGVVQRGRQRLRSVGDVHQPGLQRRCDRGAGRADAEQHHQRRPRIVRGEHEYCQHGAQGADRHIQSADHRLIRHPAADEVTDHHADAEDHQRQRNQAAGQSGDVGHRRADVGVDGEHAAKADHADEQRQPHLHALERTESRSGDW